LVKTKVDERFAVIENIDFTAKMKDKTAALRRVSEGVGQKPPVKPSQHRGYKGSGEEDLRDQSGLKL
jgi:hypothetical protein